MFRPCGNGISEFLTNVSAVSAGDGKKTAIQITGKKPGSTKVYVKIRTKKTYKLTLSVKIAEKTYNETSDRIGIIGAMDDQNVAALRHKYLMTEK